MQDSFLNKNVNIRNTIVYKKTVGLCCINEVFVSKYISKFSRTTDQMIQAARSVKQNLVEGAYDGVTSKEMEIKLFNVARGSLQELLDDYMDFLRNNKLEKWEGTDPRYVKTKNKLRNELNSDWYSSLPHECGEESCANIIITLIYQIDFLLVRLLEKSEKEFLKNGGLKETMSKYRIAVRNNQRYNSKGKPG